jgi:hypothetical protein
MRLSPMRARQSWLRPKQLALQPEPESTRFRSVFLFLCCSDHRPASSAPVPDRSTSADRSPPVHFSLLLREPGISRSSAVDVCHLLGALRPQLLSQVHKGGFHRQVPIAAPPPAALAGPPAALAGAFHVARAHLSLVFGPRCNSYSFLFFVYFFSFKSFFSFFAKYFHPNCIKFGGRVIILPLGTHLLQAIGKKPF